MSNATIMLIANAPAKVQRFVRTAHDRGLNVSLDGSTYTVSSPNPIDEFQLWLHFAPGANGGRLTATLYTPSNKRPTKKLTQQNALYWIHDMADALDRHNARQAATDAAAVRDDDLNDTASVPSRNVKAQRTAHAADLSAAVSNAQAATGAQPVNDLAVEAQAVLSALKVNGRFALRMARTGTIPRTTAGTVRQALVNRDLVSPAGGTLTALGKAVRQLVMA